MASATGARGGELVVVVFPYAAQLAADAPVALQDKIAQLGARAGLQVIDLLPAFRAAPARGAEAAFLDLRHLLPRAAIRSRPTRSSGRSRAHAGCPASRPRAVRLGARRAAVVAWLGCVLACCVSYRPVAPDQEALRRRAQTQDLEDLRVTVAVLDAREAQDGFGVPLYRRGIQPIWLEVENRGESPYLLSKSSIDPHYYSPLEAAYVSHYRSTDWLPDAGPATVLLLPLAIPGAVHALSASQANADMDGHFLAQGFGQEVIGPGRDPRWLRVRRRRRRHAARADRALRHVGQARTDLPRADARHAARPRRRRRRRAQRRRAGGGRGRARPARRARGDAVLHHQRRRAAPTATRSTWS